MDAIKGQPQDERGWSGTRARATRLRPRRLTDEQVNELTARYGDGMSINELALAYEINRTTVTKHLKRRGVETRKLVRKMTDDQVARAAMQYAQGTSLAGVADQFDVHERTLRREFARVGVPVRPRRGWPTAG